MNEAIEGETPMISKGLFTLTSIKNGVAVITVKGTTIGIGGVAASLTGDQEGEYEIEIKSGKVLNGNMSATMKGKVQIMGKDIPITIEHTIKLKGKVK